METATVLQEPLLTPPPEDILPPPHAADVSSSHNAMVVLAVTIAAGLLSAVYLYKLLVKGGTKKVLPLEDYQEFPLKRKKVLSHDTAEFTFALPSEFHELGLPIGQHVALKYVDKTTGAVVQRSYTPVESALGEVSLVVKVYRPAAPKFPNGGLMSQHLDSLSIGDTILMRGPKGHMEWYPAGVANSQGSIPRPGTFSVKPPGKPKQERYCERIGMMAGGTGITPMLQILQHIFRAAVDTSTGKTPYDHISIKLIYANQTVDDILVREELEALQKDFPTRFSLHYTVDRPPEGEWNYSTGFITPDMVQKHLLFEDNNGKTKPVQFFMCGPPPMIKFACIPALEAAGYTEKDWVVF